jgi:uncharacterized membrane protein YgaE (UPF0421/DUF939 family)
MKPGAADQAGRLQLLHWLAETLYGAEQAAAVLTGIIIAAVAAALVSTAEQAELVAAALVLLLLAVLRAEAEAVQNSVLRYPVLVAPVV